MPSSSGTIVNTTGSRDGTAIEKTRHTRVNPNEAATPTSDSDQSQPHALPHHHAAYIGRPGSQRHGDSDLLAALRHGEGHQSVNADRGEQKAAAPKISINCHIEILRAVDRATFSSSSECQSPAVRERRAVARSDRGSKRVRFRARCEPSTT